MRITFDLTEQQAMALIEDGRMDVDWIAHSDLDGHLALCEFRDAIVEALPNGFAIERIKDIAWHTNPTVCANCLGSGKAWAMQGGPHGVGSMGKCWICKGTGEPTPQGEPDA